MTLEEHERARLAERLARAYRTGEPIPPPRDCFDLTLSDGYRVQERFVEARGEGPVGGYKVGFTNRTVQDRFDVAEPAFGRLPAGTVGGPRTLDHDRFVDPKIEPEIAFEIGDAPEEYGDCRQAVRRIYPAIEVVDSRVRDWDVTAAEAVADDALASALVLGGSVPAEQVGSLPDEGVRISVGGEEVATGVGANALDDPWRVLDWLRRELPSHDERLAAGDVVSTGSLTDVVPVTAGDEPVVAFETLGEVGVCFE